MPAKRKASTPQGKAKGSRTASSTRSSPSPAGLAAKENGTSIDKTVKAAEEERSTGPTGSGTKRKPGRKSSPSKDGVPTMQKGSGRGAGQADVSQAVAGSPTPKHAASKAPAATNGRSGVKRPASRRSTGTSSRSDATAGGAGEDTASDDQEDEGGSDSNASDGVDEMDQSDEGEMTEAETPLLGSKPVKTAATAGSRATASSSKRDNGGDEEADGADDDVDDDAEESDSEESEQDLQSFKEAFPGMESEDEDEGSGWLGGGGGVGDSEDSDDSEEGSEDSEQDEEDGHGLMQVRGAGAVTVL